MAFRKSIGSALLGIIAAPMPGAAHTAPAPVSAPAPAAAAQRVDAWILYGTPAILKRDNGVVGAGSLVAAPRSAPADPWTSGAVVLIPQALAAGQSFTFA